MALALLSVLGMLLIFHKKVSPDQKLFFKPVVGWVPAAGFSGHKTSTQHAEAGQNGKETAFINKKKHFVIFLKFSQKRC